MRIGSKRTVWRKIGQFLFLVLIHMVLSLPFKVMIMIPGFTDIRPVTCVQPIFGLFYGQTGALAFAVGNLISDVLSDSLQWSCIAGFIANYLYVVMVYKLWHRIRKKAFALREGRDFFFVYCHYPSVRHGADRHHYPWGLRRPAAGRSGHLDRHDFLQQHDFPDRSGSADHDDDAGGISYSPTCGPGGKRRRLRRQKPHRRETGRWHAKKQLW